jgi:hypothetical protein
MLSNRSIKRIIYNKTSVVDPDPLNPDPDPTFQVNTDPVSDMDPVSIIFLIKNCNLLIPKPL